MKNLYIFFIIIMVCYTDHVAAITTEIIACDTCVTSTQFKAKALEHVDIDYTTGFIQKNVVIANLESKALKSYLVMISNEPGFYEREVLDTAIPTDAQVAFDAYLNLEAEFTTSGAVIVQSVPQLLRSAVFVNTNSSSCVISGDMNPVPPYVANSVTDIDGNREKQKVIAEMLRTTYVISSFSIFNTTARVFLNKLLFDRPLTVWTSFNDGTKVQWILIGTHATTPFIMLSDSAIDNDCQPVSMSNENDLTFSQVTGGYQPTQSGQTYFAGIGMSSFGNRVCQVVYSGTTSEGISKPQLACY